MDQGTLDSCLSEISVSVFEEAAFVFCEPSDEKPTWGEKVQEVIIQISGDNQGGLMLTTNQGFGQTLAANLLGLDPGDEQAQQKAEDALNEILNMIAGAVSERCFGKLAVCNIGIPKIQTVLASEHLKNIQTADTVVCMLTDEDDNIEIAAFTGGAA